MRNRGPWLAFLITCFLLTGLVGLFASYGAAIPLERALHREAALDAALAGATPDLPALRAALGPARADALLAAPGDLPAKAAAARAAIRAEGVEEQDAVAGRIRLMTIVVTLLCSALGAGLLLLAARRSQA